MDLTDFLDDGDALERRNRIRLSLAAYAYEYLDNPIMSDAEFDDLCKKIKPEVSTGNGVMDKFFKKEFAAYTGSWIRSHPDIGGLNALYQRLYNKKGQ